MGLHALPVLTTLKVATALMPVPPSPPSLAGAPGEAQSLITRLLPLPAERGDHMHGALCPGSKQALAPVQPELPTNASSAPHLACLL